MIERRDFIKGAAGAAVGLAGMPAVLRGADDRKVRVGVIGTGLRGRSLLGLILQRSDTEVPALCDIAPDALRLATDMVQDARGYEPEGYGKGEEDFRNLVTRDDLDAVMVATPWLWHTPMAVAGMRAGKHVGVEVPAAVTIDQCWDLVNTSEETGLPCMMLENVCYRRDVMAVLNMVGQGLFGEVLHCHGGYQHDIRNEKFQPGAEFGPGAESEAVWRTSHSIHRNGDIYPTHGIGPVANFLRIGYGNRFATLTSTATKSRGLHEYVVKHGGADHPNAGIEFALGDIVTTVIRTSNGETVVLIHDTNLPRPYSLNFRVQGTRGIWMSDNRSIYLEGTSPEWNRWEPFEAYQERYDHPLWKRFEEDATGAGHGGMDFFVVRAFVESVKRRVPPPLDAYAAATWSVISPLSERSIAQGSAPVAFPDFTGGRWTRRPFTFGKSDEF
ncbi:MAG: Gfo/Idh/MocA family oxidoreductase [Gemmatimonadota bacterium]|nr:Gfo/Idh/MocA family oxidoreductase [Gemmatimonadota bacterium]